MKSASVLLRESLAHISSKREILLRMLFILVGIHVFSFGFIYMREMGFFSPALNLILTSTNSVFQFIVYILSSLMTFYILASERNVSVPESYQFAKDNFIKGVKVTALVCIITVIAYLIAFGVSMAILFFDPLLGVPLIILAICFSVHLSVRYLYALYIAVLEQRHTMEAIEYAKSYTEGRILSIAWRLACAGLVATPLIIASIALIYIGYSANFVILVLSFALIPFGLFVSVYNFEIYRDLKNTYEKSKNQHIELQADSQRLSGLV